MDSYVERRMVQAVLSRLDSLDQQAAVVRDLATSLQTDPHTSRLSEARLVAEFLNLAEAGQYDAATVAKVVNALSDFILAVIGGAPDAIALGPLVTLAERNRNVSEQVYGNVLDAFLAHAAASLPSEDTQPFVVLRGLLRRLAASSSSSSSSSSSRSSILGPQQCISFFTAFFRSSAPGNMIHRFHSACLAPALAFLAGEDKDLGRAATHLAVTLVDCLPDAEHSSDSQFDVVWLTIIQLVNQRHSPSLVTPALTLWLRLAARLTPDSLLSKQEYWDALHFVLSQGSPEQQKVSLAIFRVSISAYYKSQAESISTVEDAEDKLAKYDRFMTLYQAVVLDRYINQVHETLSDLTAMAGLGEAGIQPRWLFALLSTALSANTQHSVRKFIGEWVLVNTRLFTSSAYTDSPDLLQHRFLHWAMTGTLFETSITFSRDGQLQSAHGNKLSNFIASALAGADGQETAHAHLKAILRFITVQGHRSYPHGRALIMEGINTALEGFGLVLDQEDQNIIHAIAMKSGFIDIASDYTAILSLRILSKTPTSMESIPRDLHLKAESLTSSRSSKQTTVVEARTIMENTARNVLAEPGTNTDTLSWLYHSIKETKHACLYDNGLGAAIQLLDDYLSTELRSDMACVHLGEVLSAIWEEIEVQDYQREPVMTFTSMILNKTTISVLSNDDASLLLITGILETLSAMSKRKVYLFATLARAWRALLQSCPVEASKLPLFSFFKDFAISPPVLKPEFMMEHVLAARLVNFAPQRTYESYYGKTESYAYACVFDMLNTLPNLDTYTEQAKELLRVLFSPWAQQRPTMAVFVDWKSTTQLQVILLLLEYCLPSMTEDETRQMFEDVMHVLDIELLPRYRFLIEWMAARVLYRNPMYRPYILERQREMDISNPKTSISIMKLSIMVAHFAETPQAYARELATQLVLLTGSQKIAIRHEAQWAFPQMWRLAQARGWQDISGDAIVQRVDAQIRSLDAFKNPPPSRVHESLDPVAQHCLSNLVDGYYLEIEPVERARARRSDFLSVWADDERDARIRDSAPPSHEGLMPLGEARPHIPRTTNPAWRSQPTPDTSATTSTDTSADTSTSTAAAPPLQTKGKFTLDTPARIPLSLLDAPPGPSQPSRPRPTPLILAASLIDIPFNLGGLCRAAELLGAARMVHATASGVASAAFASVAVSAQLHLPLTFAPRAELRAYLRARQGEGYEVVGVEQTDASLVLGSAGARFRPDGRTVLLLGREREGIPGELLGVCDWCVEVRQLGVTRSMNVQTAAAVVMHEYVRQFQERGVMELESGTGSG